MATYIKGIKIISKIDIIKLPKKTIKKLLSKLLKYKYIKVVTNNTIHKITATNSGIYLKKALKE
jgi:hypothetical protein